VTLDCILQLLLQDVSPPEEALNYVETGHQTPSALLGRSIAELVEDGMVHFVCKFWVSVHTSICLPYHTSTLCPAVKHICLMLTCEKFPSSLDPKVLRSTCMLLRHACSGKLHDPVFLSQRDLPIAKHEFVVANIKCNVSEIYNKV
jgi:hypothetical protein